MRLLYGKSLAEKIHEGSAARSRALRQGGIAPRLAVVSVSADPAANTYLQRLVARGTRLDVEIDDIALRREATGSDLRSTVVRLGADEAVHGILLLTPLPDGFDEARVAELIAPQKDVEGMNPVNVGLLAEGRPRFIPSTAEAVLELLRFHEVRLAGVRAAVVGRSGVVGRPVASLLLREDATVTIAHSRTKDVGAVTREAEVIVVAVGRAGYLRGEMVARGATVIDAGINMSPRGIVGDVDTESVSAVAGALSPVPGGLGGVTTELLLRNVLTAAEAIAAH